MHAFETLYAASRIHEGDYWALVRRRPYEIDRATKGQGSPAAEAPTRIGALRRIEARIRRRPPGWQGRRRSHHRAAARELRG